MATAAAPEASALDPEQERIVKKVFDKFDKDSSGQISVGEVVTLLNELGRSEEQAVRGAKVRRKRKNHSAPHAAINCMQ